MRDFQGDAVECILSGYDTLVVATTGVGTAQMRR